MFDKNVYKMTVVCCNYAVGGVLSTMLPPGNRRRVFHWEKYRRSAGDSCIDNEPPENAQWNTPSMYMPCILTLLLQYSPVSARNDYYDIQIYSSPITLNLTLLLPLSYFYYNTCSHTQWHVSTASRNDVEIDVYLFMIFFLLTDKLWKLWPRGAWSCVVARSSAI